MGIFYHFTTRFHLPKILESGYLDVTESNVSFDRVRAHAGPDVVWLFDRDTPGEHGTSLTGKKGGPSGVIVPVDKTEIRFTVEVDAEPWSTWSVSAGSPKADRRILIASGGGKAAAQHWYVFEGRIDQDHWRAIEWTATGEPAAMSPKREPGSGLFRK